MDIGVTRLMRFERVCEMEVPARVRRLWWVETGLRGEADNQTLVAGLNVGSSASCRCLTLTGAEVAKVRYRMPCLVCSRSNLA